MTEHDRIEEKQDLILRGLHLLIRVSFSPNEERARLNHLVALQKDIAPWLSDYADVFSAEAPPESR